jgi:hypothetical protein
VPPLVAVDETHLEEVFLSPLIEQSMEDDPSPPRPKRLLKISSEKEVLEEKRSLGRKGLSHSGIWNTLTGAPSEEHYVFSDTVIQ